MERLVNSTFVNSNATAGSDRELLTLQIVFFSIVLDRVLLNKKGKHLNRVYKDDPQELWIKHEAHQTSLATAQGIAINLMTKLSEMSISLAPSKSDFLEEYDATLQKYDGISSNKMAPSQKIGLLKKAALADKDLLLAWTSIEAIQENKKPWCCSHL